MFNWRTFSRRVTAPWSRGWAKNQVLTNQNSRNSLCQTVRGTICLLPMFNPCNFSDFDEVAFLLITSIEWLTFVLLKIINWNFPGFVITLLSLEDSQLYGSNLISCSTCPTDCDFRQNKKNNIDFIYTHENKMEINLFCRDFVAFTLSLDKSVNLFYSMQKNQQEFFHISVFLRITTVASLWLP